MRRVITFLGIWPKETLYTYEGKVYGGQVFAEALRQFLDFDEMLVLTTAKAAENSFPVLAAINDERIRPIPIPDARDQAEMWQIFQTLVGLVREGDEVVFDITHGLRSIPFLVFLAAAFLKSAQRARITAVYYGALELGNMHATPPQPAPVLDLSPFIDLLDWMQATAHFEATGNGKRLAELIQRSGDERAAQRLLEITRGLRLGFLVQVGYTVDELLALLEEQTQWAGNAAPLQVLFERIARKYAPLVSVTGERDEAVDLRQQAALLGWYVDNDLVLQGWLLAREWLITWVAHGLGHEDLLVKESREHAESVLNDIVHGRRHGATAKQVDDGQQAEQEMLVVPDYGRVLTLWGLTTNIRNQLAHMSMRPQGRTADAGEIMRQLQQIRRSIVRMVADHLPDEETAWNSWAEDGSHDRR